MVNPTRAVSAAMTRSRRPDSTIMVAVTTTSTRATPRAGSTINGAHAWFSLPAGFQVEPSEFAKVALILMIAMVFSQALPTVSGGPRVRSLLVALACAAPLIGLVVIEPALGVTLVLVVVTATMIVLSGLRLRVIAALTVLVAVTIAAVGHVHLLKSYQLTRFTSFLHPSAVTTAFSLNSAYHRPAGQ